tara:strand:+ start:666 stop:1280 length:615 start_codon:yes stop_codon:yes gene_type:complete
MNQKILNHHFNRKTPLEYAIWFAELQGIEIDLDLDYSKNRGLIEGQVLGQIPKEVFKPASEEGENNEEESKENSPISDGEEIGEVSEENQNTSGADTAPESLASDEISNSEDFPSSLSYDAMSVKELKAECKSRGLPIYGTKAELALRLKRDDEGISESTTETETPADEAAVEEKSDIPADEAAMTNGETNENSGEQKPVNENE